MRNRLLYFIFILASFPLFAGCPASRQDGPAKETPPVQVRTVEVVPRDVLTQSKFLGKTISLNKVDIVSRIRGFIESRDFEEGAMVEAGQPLFHIQDFDYRNAVEKATNELELAKAREIANQKFYEFNVKGNELSVGTVTQFEIIKSKSDWDVTRAQVALDETQLEYEKQQLKYTVITSPLRGKVSAAKYSKGAFLNGNGSEILCTVNEVDPMYVVFPITDAFLSRMMKQLREKAAQGGSPDAPLHIPFEMRLATGDGDEVFNGVLDYIDTEISLSTGMIDVRGKIANSDYRLFPGYICEIRIDNEPLKDVVVVDERAVCSDMTSKYVWVLGPGNKVKRRYIETETVISDGNERILRPYKKRSVVEVDGEKVEVETGLQPGDRYVVEGVIKLQDDTIVAEKK